MIDKIKQKISGAWIWIKSKAKWIIIAALGIGGIWAAGEIIIPDENGEVIPVEEYLRLKGKVLYQEQENGIVTYAYVSDVKVERKRISEELTAKELKKHGLVDEAGLGSDILEDVSKRGANYRVFNTGYQQETTIFQIGSPPFYQEDGEWYKVEYDATTTIEAFEQQTKVSLLEKLRGYFARNSLAGSGDPIYVGSGDGFVSYGDNTWSTSHDAAVGNNNDDDNTDDIFAGGCTAPFANNRGFFPVNTSAIDSNATIISATLSVYIQTVANSDSDGYNYATVVETFQASHTILGNADFVDCGYDSGNETGGRAKYEPTVEGSDQLDFDTAGTGRNTWTLNATGLGWIKRSGEASTCGSALTGWSCLGIREGHDMADHELAGGTCSYLWGRWSEYASTGNDPYFTVTYSIPDTCDPPVDDVWKMDLQDHCTTTDSVYLPHGMECYNPTGGSWVIGAGTEVRVASSTNCNPQVEATGVFSIQPNQ